MSDYTATPGQCARCGAPILWTRSAIDPNRWNRPLDMTSAVKRFAVFNGQTVYADTYVNHLCGATTPDDTNPEPAQAPEDHKLSRREEREAWLSVPCPIKECGADTGDECIQIRHLIARGKRYQETWPHVARRVLGLETRGLMHQSPTVASEYSTMLNHEASRIATAIRDGERDKREAVKLEAIYEEITAKTRCDKCGASRGVKCWNLHDRRFGTKAHTVTPHNERRKTYFSRRKA